MMAVHNEKLECLNFLFLFFSFQTLSITESQWRNQVDKEIAEVTIVYVCCIRLHLALID